MNAVVDEARSRIRVMSEEDIETILAIERRSYDFPWSGTIFRDCLGAGYCCWILEYDQGPVAYGIMSVMAGEAHIFNLCVDLAYRTVGLGEKLLMHLLEVARVHNAYMVYLEVRPSNFAAIRLYLNSGFDQIAVRRNYYPSRTGREDALILSKMIDQGVGELERE